MYILYMAGVCIYDVYDGVYVYLLCIKWVLWRVYVYILYMAVYVQRVISIEHMSTFVSEYIWKLCVIM